jgi:hypothetical protein
MGNIEIPSFFSQLPGEQFNGSLAYLDSLQGTFRNDWASGLIEVRISEKQRYVLLFASGITAGVYRLEPGTCETTSMADVSQNWGKPEVPIRSVNFPDSACRVIWLALESRPETRQEIQNEDEWIEFLTLCKTKQQTALVQFSSSDCDGFLTFQEGDLVNAETVFSTTNGIQTNIQSTQLRMNGSRQITIYEINRTANSYQCTLLRISATKWGNDILAHYREIAGQKLLQTLNTEINTLIQPWRWNIHLANATILDQHFFPKQEMAAQAYRALFLSMGEQINIVIGATLSQRLLDETYKKLSEDERSSLEVQRLIPAAFT